MTLQKDVLVASLVGLLLMAAGSAIIASWSRPKAVVTAAPVPSPADEAALSVETGASALIEDGAAVVPAASVAPEAPSDSVEAAAPVGGEDVSQEADNAAEEKWD